MSGQQWTVKYNKRTGDPYYVDNQGNVSWKKPEGFKAAAPPQRKKSGLLSSGRFKSQKLVQETTLREKQQPKWVRGEGRVPPSQQLVQEATRAPVKSWKKPSALSGIQSQLSNGQSNGPSTPSWVKSSNASTLKDKTPTPTWAANSANTAKFSNTSTSAGKTSTPSWANRSANTNSSAGTSTPSWANRTSSNATPTNTTSTPSWANRSSKPAEPNFNADGNELAQAEESRLSAVPASVAAVTAPKKEKKGFLSRLSNKRNRSFPSVNLPFMSGKKTQDAGYNATVKPAPPPKPPQLRVGYNPDQEVIQVDVDRTIPEQRPTGSEINQIKADFNASLSPNKGSESSGKGINKNADFPDSRTGTGPPPLPEKPEYLKNKKIFGANLQGEAQDFQYDNNFQYTYFAHFLGCITGVLYVVTGGFAILWHWRASGGYFRDLDTPANADIIISPIWSGPYAVILGALILWWEYKHGLAREDKYVYEGKPYRGLAYFLTAIPALASYATILPACSACLTGIFQIVATARKEVGRAKHPQYCFSYRSLFIWDRDRGTYIVGTTWILLNFTVAAYNLAYYEYLRQRCILRFGSPDNASCPSFFAPMAKFFGNMINLNCSMIVLPVVRVLLRTAAAKYDKNNIFPFKKAIEFHKIIGFAVGVSVFGHMFFHFLNFAFKPEITILLFGNAAFLTGGLLVLVMSMMYSGAHYIVRRANYEIFWKSHHFYTAFFMILLAHGPHFWEWFLIPVSFFIIEKRIRARSRGKRKIFVESAQFIPPVLNINFSPEQIEDFEFRGGQYLYMLVPAISEVEWHPFSMSSAYGDLESSGYVSIHIRVQEPGSWTYRLKEYFRIIAGQVGGQPDDPFIANNLFHYDAAGVKQKGIFNGPDGLPLIRIDGPYASPTQVYSTYRDVILVGSGIGLTPSASILRSVLRHKWKKGYYPETIRFCWILRQSELDSFHWFIELLADLSARVQADRESGALTELHYVELNIYVTGAKDLSSTRSKLNISSTETAPGTLKRKQNPSVTKQPGFSVENAIDPNDLRRMLLNPQIDAKDQGEVQMDGHRAPNRVQNIWVWRGRPVWNTIFANTEAHILRRREAQGTVYETIQVRVESEVGVCFCGAPAIGNELKKNCVRYSKKHDEIKFTLNAEIF